MMMLPSGIRFVASDGNVWEVVSTTITRFEACKLSWSLNGWRNLRRNYRQFMRKSGKCFGVDMRVVSWDESDVANKLKELDLLREQEEKRLIDLEKQEEDERNLFEQKPEYQIAERIINNMKGSCNPDIWVGLGIDLLRSIENRFIELGHLKPRKDGA